MYADRHARSSAIDPCSLGIAVALNGAVVAALLLAQPVLTIVGHKRDLPTYNVPIDEPPPERPESAARHPLQRQTPVALPTQVDLHQLIPVETIDLLPPIGRVVPDLGPVAGPITSPATPAPMTIGAEVDPAHRGDLQPTYPAGELRAEREGIVVVRVLIGLDGRVHQVERVDATSDAFFDATRDRALGRWRFRPATRGGVPVEAWRTMTIRFVIPR